MPHIDEGTLHALIDGALRAEDPDRAAEVEGHLAGCEDCRARLEAARELRDEATGILAAAAPAPAAPDFDDVIARSEASHGAGRTTRPGSRRTQQLWTRRVSWAATVVLALGTGYLLRDLVEPPAPPPAASVAERSASPPGRTEQEETARDPEPSAPDDRGQALAAGDRDDVDGPDAARASDSADRRQADESRTAEAPEGNAAGSGEEVVVASGAPAADAPSGAQADQSQLRQASAGRTRPAEPGPQTRAAVTLEAAALAAATDTPTIRWTAVTLEEAARAMNGPIYVLPHAEVLDVQLAGSGDDARVAMEQRLESGVPVRVVQRRGEGADGVDEEAELTAAPRTETEAEPPAAGSAAADRAARGLPGPARVEAVHGPFVLEVQGQLPAELLSILAGSAKPAGAR